MNLWLQGADRIKEAKAGTLERIAKTPDEAFEKEFSRRTIGSSLASLFDASGEESEWMLRKDTFSAAKCAITSDDWSECTTEERESIFTSFDTDSSAFIHRQEFLQSARAMRDRAARPNSPVHYKSINKYWDDWHRHKRIEDFPQEYQRRPVTANQEFGWLHTSGDSVPREKRPYFNKPSTDVTQSEGVTPSYNLITRGF